MSVKRIASRYAKSLLDFAKEQGQLDAVTADIDWFLEAAKSKDLRSLLKSPIVGQSKKKEIFKAIFSDNLSQMTNTFFNIILTKGRESLLTDIAAEYKQQIQILNKISSVTLKTASPLSDELINQIKDKLLASNITDENVELETEVDPSILGGYILQIGDKLYDDSIAYKLNKLKKEFSDNKYVKAY